MSPGWSPPPGWWPPACGPGRTAYTGWPERTPADVVMSGVGETYLTWPGSEFLFSVQKRNLRRFRARNTHRFLFLKFFRQFFLSSHRNIWTTKMVDHSLESLFWIRKDEIIIKSSLDMKEESNLSRRWTIVMDCSSFLVITAKNF